MRKKSTAFSIILTLTLVYNTSAMASETAQTPTDKPEQLYHNTPNEVLPTLAHKGKFTVGVKTVEIINQQSFNPATQQDNKRKLTLEIWYPATVANNMDKTVYKNVTRTHQPFTIQADAYRNVDIRKASTKYPLIVLSHGYTGYRTIMYYLGEHLASNGYIVAAIDHTDSTNADIDVKKSPYAGFPSTLLNRSRDQAFVKEYLTHQKTFLSSMIDTQHTGLVGYSMGAYGAVKSAGGCYNFTAKTTQQFTGISDKKMNTRVTKFLNRCNKNSIASNKALNWQAVVAMAPWGEQYHLYNDQSLKSIKTPMLYIDGDLDDVADHPSIEKLFQLTGSNHKYFLTYINARHNIAPHPAPLISYQNEFDLGHYYEPSWGNEQLNNRNKHFVLAMMNCYVKNITSDCNYLSLPEYSDSRINGKETAPWLGFGKRYSLGMRWQSNQQ